MTEPLYNGRTAKEWHELYIKACQELLRQQSKEHDFYNSEIRDLRIWLHSIVKKRGGFETMEEIDGLRFQGVDNIPMVFGFDQQSRRYTVRCTDMDRPCPP